jgi:hypothetical protein
MSEPQPLMQGVQSGGAFPVSSKEDNLNLPLREKRTEEKPWDAEVTGVVFGPQATDLGKRAVLAFRRDLPQLLKEKPGQWVAYHGDQRVGFARTAIELYKECARLGLPDDDFIVHPIEPLPPSVVSLD